MDTNLKEELSKGLEKLEGLLDDLKVRAHLAGMDVKTEWNELEPRARETLETMKRDASKASQSALSEAIGALEKLRAKL